MDMMIGERAPERLVLEIAGEDRVSFLQGLVSNDVRRIDEGAIYAAFLTPQGKYLVDFFLYPGPDGVIWLDVAAGLGEDLLRRLSMYRLRAKVTIGRTDLAVSRGLGDAPAGAFADPRDPSLGWRRVGAPEGGAPVIDWDAIRVAGCIPETGIELIPNETYILEAGFERLHGVDFRKGCYVGQEVTARMKHKTELRKGFVTVILDGEAAPGTPVMAGEKEAGRLFTVSGNRAIAWMRFDRAEGVALVAGSAGVSFG